MIHCVPEIQIGLGISILFAKSGNYFRQNHLRAFFNISLFVGLCVFMSDMTKLDN
jgi:hypothetical protein